MLKTHIHRSNSVNLPFPGTSIISGVSSSATFATTISRCVLLVNKRGRRRIHQYTRSNIKAKISTSVRKFTTVKGVISVQPSITGALTSVTVGFIGTVADGVTDLLGNSFVLELVSANLDSPKFENLVAPRVDSEERLKAFLNLEKTVRSFNLGIPDQSVSVMSSGSQFALSDLGDYLAVKKEKTSPSTVKTRVMPLRSSKSSKKRKSTELVDLESPTETLRNVGVILQSVLERMSAEKETIDKEMEEMDNFRKIAVGKASQLEKENAKLKKQLKDMEAANKIRVREVVEGAKRSAATAILQSQIKMALATEKEGISIFSNDLADWKKALNQLMGISTEDAAEDVATKDAEDVGTSKEAEKAVVAEDHVTPGDEGKDAQA